MRLFHLSEDPYIDRFVPRPVPNPSAWPAITFPVVWAISGEMVPNYYFPRNCPRVCRMLGPLCSAEEISLFKAWGASRAVIFVDESRQAEIARTVLYRYELDPSHFYTLDDEAGYFVSSQVEIPLKKQKIADLPQQLRQCGVKLQFVTDLEPFRAENASSNYRFSNIRMHLRKKIPRTIHDRYGSFPLG
jgi:hypothetical protein